jgi:hypothetical protein
MEMNNPVVSPLVLTNTAYCFSYRQERLGENHWIENLERPIGVSTKCLIWYVSELISYGCTALHFFRISHIHTMDSFRMSRECST